MLVLVQKVFVTCHFTMFSSNFGKLHTESASACDVKGNTNIFRGDTKQLACSVDNSQWDSNILLLQELLCNFI